jgi:hypothetical protein
MVKGIAAMQSEVDSFRRSARQLVRDAAAKRRAGRTQTAVTDESQAARFRSRADVEQSKVAGMRHNLAHCSNAEPPGDED